jgi:hypothetical protein
VLATLLLRVAAVRVEIHLEIKPVVVGVVPAGLERQQVLRYRQELRIP